MYPSMYFHQPPSQPHPSGYRVGYLLAGLISAPLVLAGAYGVGRTTSLPFLIGFLLIIILHAAKMFFLRSQPFFEQMFYDGWDRIIGYSSTAFFSVALAALGLYCLAPSISTPSKFTRANLVNRPATREGPSDGSSFVIANQSDEQSETDEVGLEPLRFNMALQGPGKGDLTGTSLRVSPEEAGSITTLPNFLRDTLVEQKSAALGCWAVTGILELAVLLLVLYNRRRYLPYLYME